MRFLLIVLCTGVIMAGCCSQKNLDSQYESLEHYENGKFKNTQIEYKSDFSSFLSNAWKFITNDSKNKIPQENAIPVKKLSKQDILDMPNNSMIRIIHSTLLFKLDNKYILTDPVFSEKITPFPFVAPKRFHELPITIEELPFIDIIIISHNHYDHLDEPSIKKLKDKVGNFYTTLGIKKQLIDFGVDTMKICELDWWQSCTNKTIKISATPAQHFSGRGLFDRNNTLWASWVIKSKNTNIFFSADTGYFEDFKKIGKKYGPFDIAFLEAGAYNESWKEIHMMPTETIQAFKDLNANILFPIHNSSFKLSMHPWNEPLEMINNLAKEDNIKVSHPKMGEIIPLLEYKETDIWWK